MKKLLLVIISMIFLTSCMSYYKELNYQGSRFLIRNDENIQQEIANLESAGFKIKSIEKSSIVDDVIVVYVE